ncbi:MAG TPA: ABC transporter permease [Vicinamibacteria bacterium]|nr:ABC transporter permease [Vicinamibacteria bacterium]
MRGGAGILIGLTVLATVGPFLVSHSPVAQDRNTIYSPPSLGEHPFGTDGLGRDVLSRSIHAARYSWATAWTGVLLTLFLGTLAGAVSGLVGGNVDRAVMRGTELFMAFPALYLFLALRNLFPDELTPVESGVIVVASLATVGWCSVARFVRGQVLEIRERDYVTAAVAFGAPRRQVIRIHVLRALSPVLLLQAGLLFPYFVLGEVTLSFLGLGLQEPYPSWGNMLASSVGSLFVLREYWWCWLAPATFLTVASLGANLGFEGIRERIKRA